MTDQIPADCDSAGRRLTEACCIAIPPGAPWAIGLDAASRKLIAGDRLNLRNPDHAMKNLMAFQATVVLGVAWSCAIANAQPPLVDQANETFVSTYFPLSPAGGVGQEFSPTLNSLGFVDVWIFNEAPVGPADFTVRIREGSIAGGILGASEMATIGSPPSLGPTRFAFAATVGLTGGATHVLEVVQVMGGAGWGAGYGPNSGYAAGQAIFGTSPVDYDLWFREGVLVPEPGVWVLGGLGTVLAGCILRRRSGSA